MTAQYKVSRWSNAFVRGDIAALFHSISLARLFIPKDIGSSLISLKGQILTEEALVAVSGNNRDVFDHLKTEGFIVPSDADEMKYLADTRDKLLLDVSLEKMYLLLTDACNMACAYCSEEIKELHHFRAKYMTTETIDRSLECFARLTRLYGGRKPRSRICLYGGEPLLNRDGVFHAVEKTTEMKAAGGLPKDTFVYSLTNGQLFTEEYAKLFVKHGVGVSISIDGPKHINDTHRITKQGTSPFAKAAQAYHLAKQHGVDVGLSTTLTQEVVDNFDETLDFFIDDLGFRECITLFILHYTPCFTVEPTYYEKAALCIIKAHERFSALGITEDSMQKKIGAFSGRAPILAECGANGGTLVIAPEGTVGPCVDLIKPRLFLGGSVHDADYDPIKSGLYDRWRTRSPLFMDKCVDCPALGFCGGGCPVSVECQTGNRWDIDPRICPHSKLTLEWLLWKTYGESEGKSLRGSADSRLLNPC